MASKIVRPDAELPETYSTDLLLAEAVLARDPASLTAPVRYDGYRSVGASGPICTTLRDVVWAVRHGTYISMVGPDSFMASWTPITSWAAGLDAGKEPESLHSAVPAEVWLASLLDPTTVQRCYAEAAASASAAREAMGAGGCHADDAAWEAGQRREGSVVGHVAEWNPVTRVRTVRTVRRLIVAGKTAFVWWNGSGFVMAGEYAESAAGCLST